MWYSVRNWAIWAKQLLLGLLASVATHCSRPDSLVGCWLAQAEAFVPRAGWAGTDSLLRQAAYQARTGDTLVLQANQTFGRRLTGLQTNGNWHRAGDTLRITYSGGLTDQWLIRRLAADTLYLSPLASPSIIRVYVREAPEMND